MNRFIIEKVLEGEIKVSCNDGEIHTIGFANLINVEEPTIDVGKCIQ